MHSKNTLRLLALSLVGSLAFASGCDSKKEADGAKAEKADKKDGDKAEKKDKPALMLSNDTEVCRKALECCVESVKVENDGKAEPDQINLSCSGVAMASDDDTCKQFADGYKYTFEKAKAEVPAVCG